MSSDFEDKFAIIETIQNWALWRDAGDWERFRTVWHDDGWMTATWFQGTADDFIAISQEGLRQRREHPALPGRLDRRRGRRPRHLRRPR